MAQFQSGQFRQFQTHKQIFCFNVHGFIFPPEGELLVKCARVCKNLANCLLLESV